MVEYTKPEEVVMLREVAASRRGANRHAARSCKLGAIGAIVTPWDTAGIRARGCGWSVEL